MRRFARGSRWRPCRAVIASSSGWSGRSSRSFTSSPPTRRSSTRRYERLTGPARDLDVHVLHFADREAMLPEELRPDLGALLEVLRRRRVLARKEMVAGLTSERLTQLLSEWGTFLNALVVAPQDGRPDATTPIGALAGKRIA